MAAVNRLFSGPLIPLLPFQAILDTPSGTFDPEYDPEHLMARLAEE